MKNWRRSLEVRAYVEALRCAAEAQHGDIRTGSELDQWIRWAHGYADLLDPLRKREEHDNEE